MNGTVQLFNLAKDIGEQNDLSLQEPEKVIELRAMLHNWREKVNAKTMPKQCHPIQNTILNLQFTIIKTKMNRLNKSSKIIINQNKKIISCL